MADGQHFTAPLDASQDPSVMHGISSWLDDSIIEVPEIEAFKAALAAKGMH